MSERPSKKDMCPDCHGYGTRRKDWLKMGEEHKDCRACHGTGWRRGREA